MARSPSPVFSSPVFASPLLASPVFALPVFALPVFALPVFALRLFAALLIAAPLTALSPAPAMAQSGNATVAAPAAATVAVSSDSGVLSVPLPPEVPQLRLRGSGQFRWFGLRIYDASLWSATGNASGDATDRPQASAGSPTAPDKSSQVVDFKGFFALQLRYHRSFEGSAIAQRSLEEIERLGLGSSAQRQAWRAAMGRLFPDVKEGERLTGLHLPGRGARFFQNERLLGDIDDPEFARAFFSIWLSPATREPALRQALLGLAR